jgi:lysophospholipase L1-like esterase
MKVLFLGHSLVEYYDWQGRFPGHRVHNLGVAGETAGGLLARVGTVSKDHPDADLLLVMTGTNDVLMGDSSFLDIFRRLAERLRATWPESRLVVFGILPAHPEWMELATVRRINRKLAKIAGQAEAEFRDLTDLFTDDEGEVRTELLLEDGVHLSGEGYRVWSEAMEDLLAESGGTA